MKKLITAGLVSLVLAGCGGKGEQKPQQPAQPPQPTQTTQSQQQPVQDVKQPSSASDINIPKEELTNAQWTPWKNNYEESVSYRTKDVGSKTGIWLKKVDKDDRDTEYKHYRADCAGGPVIKDAEIEVKLGYVKRKTDFDAVDNPYKADAIRGLVCR